MIPVLDVLGGRVVRAQRGERHAYRPIVSPLAAGSDPQEMARALLARCASAGHDPVLYLADLDAIQGAAPKLDMLRGLLALHPALTLWLDAGFSGAPAAQALSAALGADAPRLRPVYGSESLAGPQALAALAADPQAILSLDCRQAQPVDPAGAWTQPHAWPRTLIVMTLDRVGAGSGPDLETFSRLREMVPDRVWIGAGGIRDAADLQAAAHAGAAGWLVASALHDGRIGSS